MDLVTVLLIVVAKCKLRCYLLDFKSARDRAKSKPLGGLGILNYC